MLSGNSGVTSRVRARLCVSTRSLSMSVPLKQSSAQYDPARLSVCECVCIAEEKRSSTRRDTESRASGAVAARRRQPSNGIITRIQRRTDLSRTSQRRPPVGQAAQVSCLCREDATETGLLGCSPLSRLVGNFSADSALQTCGIKGYCGPQGTGYFYLEIILFLERPFESDLLK